MVDMLGGGQLSIPAAAKCTPTTTEILCLRSPPAIHSPQYLLSMLSIAATVLVNGNTAVNKHRYVPCPGGECQEMNMETSKLDNCRSFP